jgi:hypothetical protein
VGQKQPLEVLAELLRQVHRIGQAAVGLVQCMEQEAQEERQLVAVLVVVVDLVGMVV